MTPAPPAEGERQRLAAITIAVLAAYLLLSHTTFLVPDSSGTYAWGRSILFDRDVDFTDELARLGSIRGDDRVRFHAETATGRPGNPFGMGSGLLWAPAILVAEVGLRLTGAAASPAGYSDAHILAASAATALYGLGALLLSYVVAARFFRREVALAAALAAGFGTPFLVYLVHLPTYAHVNAAFAAALVLWTTCRARDGEGVLPWLAAGAAVGLAALIRAQHLLLLIVPFALWVEGARRDGLRRTTAALAALGAGCAAVFSLQLAAWAAIYGSPFTVPQGGGFLELMRPHLVGVLFSAWHGLFPWAPLLLLAVPGLVLLAGRDRALGIGISVAVVAETWLVASVPDWWGGYAFGARRLVDLTPLFALALAGSFAFLRERWGKVVPAAVAAAAIAANLALATAVRTGLLSPFREVGFGELLAALPRAVVRLPAYLWQQLTSSRAEIHLIVHRDSPVQPHFDAAPVWLLPFVLAACWAVGLAAVHLCARSRWTR